MVVSMYMLYAYEHDISVCVCVCAFSSFLEVDSDLSNLYKFNTLKTPGGVTAGPHGKSAPQSQWRRRRRRRRRKRR